MGGLYRLFTKILPIMMLICFICFGISHTFQQPNKPPLTYLRQETINIGTEQNPEYKTLYTFDATTYASNINQNILKKSIEHTLDIEAYQQTLNKFKTIWADGYDFADVSKTIVNGILLAINTAILPINMMLVPIRIIAGILLTGMSLIGINIQNGLVICPMLLFILNKLAIPFLGQTASDDNPYIYYAINDSQWVWNSQPNNLISGTNQKKMYTGTYLEIEISGVKVELNTNTIYYREPNSTGTYGWYEVYWPEYGWIDESYRNLYIPLETFENDSVAQPLYPNLVRNAEQIT